MDHLDITYNEVYTHNAPSTFHIYNIYIVIITVCVCVCVPTWFYVKIMCCIVLLKRTEEL